MADGDWRALMVAAQRGDATAYRRLLAALDAWLHRYFARRLPPATVDDAVQDTLLAIHEKRHTFDPGQAFEPWLAAIARYKWIDRLRHMRRHPTEALDDAVAVDLEGGEDHGEAVTTAHALEHLLATLKPAQADAIRLVKLEGYSIEEASVRTGQTASLVKVNIHRGLGRMAALVRQRTDDE